MTRSELNEKLVARFPQPLAKDADLAVKTALAVMVETLSKGHRIGNPT